MKKTHSTLLLTTVAVALLSLAAFPGKTKADDVSVPSCCGGGAPAVPLSDVTTNTVPDQLATCPVSGEKLGSDMGKPYVFVYQGQEVKLCCKGCLKDFNKTPEKYLGKIRAADQK